MLSRATINIIRRTICNNARTFYYVRNFLESNLLTHDSNTKEYNIQNHYNLYVAKRFKSNRRKIVDNVINNNTLVTMYLFMFSFLTKDFFNINKNIFEILQKKSRDEDSDEEEEENEEVPAGSKMLTINVPSLRLDTISKAGFGISRKYV